MTRKCRPHPAHRRSSLHAPPVFHRLAREGGLKGSCALCSTGYDAPTHRKDRVRRPVDRLRLHGLLRAATTAAALVVVLASAGPARAYVRATEQHSQLPTFWTSSCEIVTIYTNGFAQMTTDEVAKSIAAAAHAWSPELVTCPKSANSDAGSGHPSFENHHATRVWRRRPERRAGREERGDFSDGELGLLRRRYCPDTPKYRPVGAHFDADIEVNAATIDFVWANLDPNSPPARGGQDQIDLRAAITHEFGHFLGLAHTCFDLGPDGRCSRLMIRDSPARLPDGNAQQSSCHVVLRRTRCLRNSQAGCHHR